MRSFRSSGSVEGVMGNRHPYSDSWFSGVSQQGRHPRLNRRRRILATSDTSVRNLDDSASGSAGAK
jgi:hypothetical protein